MPDEELTEGSEELEEGQTDDTESTPEDPTVVLANRVAALELAQRQSVAEIRTAVGRVQSLAAQLEKTKDPAAEVKLRNELAGVSDLLGLVTDSIDESILPKDVKRRVADAQAAARSAVADAEINRRIAEATAPPAVVTQAAGSDPNALEVAVIAQIRSMGLDDKDPAFDWSKAGQILATQGQAAMWQYFGEVEKTLMGLPPEGGPQRRGKAAPKAAGTPSEQTDLEKFLDKNASLEDKLAQWRALGIM